MLIIVIFASSRFLGVVYHRCDFGRGYVPAVEIHPPCAHRTLAHGVSANRVAGTAGCAAWTGFTAGPIVTWGLGLTSAYLMLAGIAQQITNGGKQG